MQYVCCIRHRKCARFSWSMLYFGVRRTLFVGKEPESIYAGLFGQEGWKWFAGEKWKGKVFQTRNCLRVYGINIHLCRVVLTTLFVYQNSEQHMPRFIWCKPRSTHWHLSRRMVERKPEHTFNIICTVLRPYIEKKYPYESCHLCWQTCCNYIVETCYQRRVQHCSK